MVGEERLLWGWRGKNWLIGPVGTQGVMHLLHPAEAIWIYGKPKLEKLLLLDEIAVLSLTKFRCLSNPVPACDLFLGHVGVVVDAP